MDDASRWSKLKPMEGPRWPIRCGHVFTAEDLVRLREGLWPRGVDDRWAVHVEDDILRCWLSWTGTCIYETRITVAEDGSGVAGLLDVLDNVGETYRRAASDEGELERFEGVMTLIRQAQRDDALNT